MGKNVAIIAIIAINLKFSIKPRKHRHINKMSKNPSQDLQIPTNANESSSLANKQKEPLKIDESKDQKGFKQFELKCGLKSNVKYSKIEHFKKMKSEKMLKVLIIGAIGTGKSSMISKIMGVKYMHKFFKKKVNWKSEHGDLLRVDSNDLLNHFESDNKKFSVTKESSFVISHLMGNETRRRVRLIDTPGLFDPEENATDEIRKRLGIADRKRMIVDLKEKLEVLGSVDAVMLMMALSGGRVTGNLVITMQSFEHMFKRSKGGFITNVALTMSKCDESSIRNYYEQMNNKDKEYIGIIKEFQKYGVEISENDTSQLFFLTATDETMDSIGRIDELNRLFQFFNSRTPLKTEQIEDPTAIIQGKQIRHFR